MSEEERGGLREQLLEFIECYRSETCLWKTKSKDYHNRDKKNAAYKRLVNKYRTIDRSADKNVVIKKINNLRTTYKRELNKIKKSGESGSGEIYTPRLWYFDSLRFLYEHEIPTTSTSNIDEDESETQIEEKKSKTAEDQAAESSEESDDDSRQSPIDIIIKEEPQVEEQTLPKIQYVSSRPRLTRVLKRKLMREPERPNILERNLYKRQNFYKKKDECDSFGEYIAMSLRKHDERTRSMIKQAINNILFEQEMKKYNASSSQYVVISTVDENPLVSD